MAQSIAMRGNTPTRVYAASGVIAGVAGWAANWFGASWFGGEYDETQIVLASSDFFLGDEPDNEPDPTLIRKQLDSGRDREKLDAMKRIIAVRFLDIFFSSTDTFISSFPKVMMSPNIFIRLPGTSTPKISRYGNWSIFTF